MYCSNEEMTVNEFATLTGIAPEVIVEIGANDGEHTLQMLGHFPDAKVYTFEPDARAYAKLTAACGDAHGRHVPTNGAVSDVDGMIPLLQSWTEKDPDWSRGSTINHPHMYQEVFPLVRFKEVLTMSHRFDTWATLLGFHEIDLLWMDAEGSEQRIIKRGQHILQRTRAVYLEFAAFPLYNEQGFLHDILQALPGNWTIMGFFELDNKYKLKSMLLRNADFY